MTHLTARLAHHRLDSVAMVVESHASGCSPELCAVKADLASFRRLLDEASDVVARIETRELSPYEAQRLCGWATEEEAPDTMRASSPETIEPPEQTVPCSALEESA